MSVWISHAAMETIILYKHTHTAAAPAPLFSHTFSSLRDGEVTLTLTWDETFTTTHAVQMYCVRSDLCPEQCVESDTPFLMSWPCSRRGVHVLGESCQLW